MQDTSNIDELLDLEDKDIVVKQKVKKDHKIEEEDIFYRAKLSYNNYSSIFRIKKNDNLKRNDLVIVPTTYGNEIGHIQGRTTDMNEILSQDEILDIIRIANEKDISKYQNNHKKSKEAFKVTLDKIREHRLEMKLINVHYFLEDSKILFNFTADGRVDFRDLVKDLASIFKTRIELRQIGVRDECRIMNSYGECGRHLCCSNVLNDLNPITIKMAKEQNITLNSLKISGTCGRLLCCLAYEYETYAQEKKSFPPEGAKIIIGNNLYTVIEVNIQSKKLKLLNEKDKDVIIYVKSDLVYRNKKNNNRYTIDEDKI